MASEFTDNFNRADNDSLGANWAEVYFNGGTTGGDIDIVSNAMKVILAGGSDTTRKMALVNQAMSSVDHYVQFDCSGFTNAPTIVTRVNSLTVPNTMYTFSIRPQWKDVYIGARNSGTQTHYTQVTNITWTNGDWIKCQTETTDASTVTNTIFNEANGTTAVATWADTNASRVTAGDYVGIYGTDDNAIFDNCDAGSLGAAPATSDLVSVGGVAIADIASIAGVAKVDLLSISGVDVN